MLLGARLLWASVERRPWAAALGGSIEPAGQLVADGRQGARRVPPTQGWTRARGPVDMAYPASQYASSEPPIEGPAITLAARHTKVRFAGYSI